MKKNNHFIVTGGAGFIGSHIAKRLINDGYRVTILDNLSTGNEDNIPKKADFINTDLGQEKSLELIKNLSCDAVLHLAGQSSGEASFHDPLLDLRSHVMSTFFLLKWCKKKGINRFLYASSMSVYGDPDYIPVDEKHPVKPKTFYASAKASAENYIKLYQSLGVNTTIFRLFSVYGPGQNLENKYQGMVSIYLSYMLEGNPIIVKGSKDRLRDLVYIDDVVDAWVTAIDNPISFGKLYNVATGEKTTVEELINCLKNTRKEFNDCSLVFQGNTMGDQFGVTADISLIKKELNFKPKYDLQTGIKNMVEERRRF